MSEIFYLTNGSNYLISFEKIVIDQKDVMKRLKNPLLWLVNGLEMNNLDKILNDLKNEIGSLFGITTKNIPLYSKHFDLLIDDRLFEKHYEREYENKERTMIKDYDYERIIYISYFTKEDVVGNKINTLQFSKKYLETKVALTNKDNFIKVFINLLNSFAIFL